MTSRRPPGAREADDARKLAKRKAQARCGYDFQTRADHEERCVCDPPCSRDYDPMPAMLTLADRDEGRTGGEAWPPSGDFYGGTGIGALYGGPMTPAQAAELAGWNIKTGSTLE